MRGLGYGTLALIVIILVIVLGIGLWLGGFWLQRETAPFRGDVQAIERVQSGDFRIAAYERFFDLCAAVQTDEERLRALEDELERGVGEERREQILSSVTAIRASRAGKINRYNTEASQDYTVGQFRDSGLPFNLDIGQEETRCVL